MQNFMFSAFMHFNADADPRIKRQVSSTKKKRKLQCRQAREGKTTGAARSKIWLFSRFLLQFFFAQNNHERYHLRKHWLSFCFTFLDFVLDKGALQGQPVSPPLSCVLHFRLSGILKHIYCSQKQKKVISQMDTQGYLMQYKILVVKTLLAAKEKQHWRSHLEQPQGLCHILAKSVQCNKLFQPRNYDTCVQTSSDQQSVESSCFTSQFWVLSWLVFFSTWLEGLLLVEWYFLVVNLQSQEGHQTGLGKKETIINEPARKIRYRKLCLSFCVSWLKVVFVYCLSLITSLFSPGVFLVLVNFFQEVPPEALLSCSWDDSEPLVWS